MTAGSKNRNSGGLRDKVRKGSFTIEASLIMPVVLLVCFSCLYFCFHVHNRTFLTAAACESAVCGSIEAVKEDGDPYEAARERSLQLGSTGFFGTQSVHTQTIAGEGQDGSIRVTYELDTVFSFFSIRWGIRAEGEAALLEPVSYIRNARRGE